MSVAVPRPYPTECKCGTAAPGPNHWKWNPHPSAAPPWKGYWRCKIKVQAAGRRYGKKLRTDSVRGPVAREKAAVYAKANRRYGRYKAYRSWDNRKYGGVTIAWTAARELMGQGCSYCGLPVCEGLDRRDNTKGHSEDNVVPCCFVCNTILCDLPEEAKDLLADGLRAARDKGLLDAWIPPQKRS